MGTWLLALVLLLATRDSNPEISTVTAAEGSGPPVRGVSLSLYHPEDRARVPQALDGIVSLGANTVCLLYTLEQDGIHSDSVTRSDRPECSDSLILSVASQARMRGLKVALFPLLHLRDTAPGKWRGSLRPRHWARWFQSYGNALSAAASVADSARAQWFCVGAELVTTEGRGRDWRRLLRRIRGSCHGKLFYSQNWDHTRKLPFEAGLDAVGMNAYFELSPELRPSPAQLLRAWTRTRQKLESTWPRPAPVRIFTEVGYPSVDGAARSPWNYEQPGRANAKLQKDCLEAFFRAWAGSPAIHGAIIYLWSEQEDAAGTHYSIRAKPAEAIVRKWFRAGFPREGNP